MRLVASFLNGNLLPMTDEEKRSEWGKEMTTGFGFAHELDLYQAITTFKRAQFLIPPEEKARTLEIEYEVVLCYYMGKKWKEVTYTPATGKLENLPTLKAADLHSNPPRLLLRN